MAVPCPGCGREYDVALFAFGRTLHCTCGARVGLEARRLAARAAEPRFLADAMLGRLARWLRGLGYDTVWEADISDAELARRALAEARTILTRDRAFPEEWRLADLLVLDSEEPLAQLRQVARRFGLDPSRPLFTRCLVCNALLVPASRARVAGRVPPRVLAARERFSACPACDKVYWEGSHTARMRRVLLRALGE
jgi:hypothetical protein